MSIMLFFALLLLCVAGVIPSSLAATQPHPAVSLEALYRTECDVFETQLPRKPVRTCVIFQSSIKDFTLRSLVSTLESANFERQHSQLTRIYSRYLIYLTAKSDSTLPYYQEVDDFLTERPWWIVRQYPVTTDFIPWNTPAVKITQNLTHHNRLILERVPSAMESVLRGFVSQSFPVSCANRSLYVKTTIGSWGNDMIVNMMSFVRHSLDEVHMLYVTHSGSVKNQVGFVEFDAKPDCVRHVNKHLCTFLPISNCTLPLALRNCQDDQKCIIEGHYHPNENLTDHVLGNLPGDPHAKTFFSMALPANLFPSSLEYRQRDIRRGVVADNIESKQRSDFAGNELALTGMFGIVYRPNYHLGLHIQRLLESFYDSSDPDSTVSQTIDRNLRCHAVHIRMGDRYINRSTNMFDWCAAHTNKSAASPEERWIGQWIDGRKLTRSHWHNMGCHCRNPFGTLSLQHFVNASITMNPNISDLVVVSDDYQWLKAYDLYPEELLWLSVSYVRLCICLIYRELKLFLANGSYRDRIRIHLFPTAFEIGECISTCTT